MSTLTHIAAVVLVATLTSSSLVKSPVNDAGEFELLILHNNDMHARFEQTSQLSGTCTPADRDAGKCYGGFPRVAYVVKEARRAAASGEGPPVLYLNAGDTYTGTAWFTIYKWKIAAEFINALKPDAVSLGNHEFDNGISGLTPFIENISCPVLASNLILTDTPELEKEPNLKKSYVFDIYGTKIGVIGYLTPDTKKLAIPNSVEYIDEIEGIKKEAKMLKNGGVNIIIALGHSGYSKDLEIAKEIRDVDLVIGGHTNTFLYNGSSPDSESQQGPYPTFVTQPTGKSVPVVQAYAYTKYLGHLSIKFDKYGEITKIYGNPILLDKSIPQDPEVTKIIEKYQKDPNNIGYEVVGNTSVILDGSTCNIKECNLGNLITDAMLYYYATHYRGEDWTDAPIAIIQGGAIRASVAHVDIPFTIIKADLLTVMPFGGSLVTITMNGRVLLDVLEYSVSKYDLLELPGQFLQYSGIKVVYNLRKPIGSRVVKAQARCSSCKVPQYTNIDMSKTYKIIIPDFLSNGGDGYDMLKSLPVEVLHYNELTCTEHYIRHHSPVYPEEEGRITILHEDECCNNAYSMTVSTHIKIMISILSIYYLPNLV